MFLSVKGTCYKEHILNNGIYMKCPVQKNPEIESELMVACDQGEGKGVNMGNDHNVYGVSFWGVESILKLNCVDDCTIL